MDSFSDIVKKNNTSAVSTIKTRTYEEWIISRNTPVSLYYNESDLHKFMTENLTVYTSILLELSDLHEIFKSISYREFIDIMYNCITVDRVIISSEEEETEDEDEFISIYN